MSDGRTQNRLKQLHYVFFALDMASTIMHKYCLQLNFCVRIMSTTV